MIVATAGHVDHGKTSLVKHLTGIDTDRLEEEKRRGLSINLGYAYRPLDDGTVIGFIDVPGHSRFINTMIAGISGIDVGLLVVAADDGIMPQTLEHIDVLRLLGVPRYILVVTKIDRVDNDRVREVGGAALSLLPAGTLAYRVSNSSAEGIDTLRAELDELASDWQERAAGGHFRMSVDRAFNLKGAGLVVTGTVASGTVHQSDQLLLQPAGQALRVRSLRAQDREADCAGPGMRCALNISGDVSKAEIERGDWVTALKAIAPTQRFDARVELLAAAPFALRQLSPVKIHLGAKRVAARLYLLGEQEEASRFKPGEQKFAQLLLEAPVVCCHGDRFLLRDHGEGVTLGGGMVLDPFAPRSGKSAPGRLEWLGSLETDSPIAAIRKTVLERRDVLDLEEFASAWNLLDDELEALLAANELAACRLVSADATRVLVSAETWRACTERVAQALQHWQQENPGEAGVTPAVLKRQAQGLPRFIGYHVMDQREGVILNTLFVPLLTDLLKNGGAELRGGLLSLPGHQSSLPQREQEAWAPLEKLLLQAGHKIPALSQLVEDSGGNRKAVLAVLERARRDGRAHKLNETRYALPSALLDLARLAQQLATDHGNFTVIQFRDAVGCGRNLAIEILEYFDKLGYTLRQGDTRAVRQDRIPEDFFSG